MAKFEYTWDDGHVTSVNLPSENGWSCSTKNPSTAMKNASTLILSEADGSTNEHEIESYCFAASGHMAAMFTTSREIKNKWWNMRDDCDHKVGICSLCRCKDKGIYCYKSKNDLTGYYNSWKGLDSSILGDKSALLQKWEDASAKIQLDGQQAINWNLLQQLIAETNQQITIVAYDTESKELDIASQKAQQIFAPVIIGLILLLLGFYLYKK
jgi:hypothetical protein